MNKGKQLASNIYKKRFQPFRYFLHHIYKLRDFEITKFFTSGGIVTILSMFKMYFIMIIVGILFTLVCLMPYLDFWMTTCPTLMYSLPLTKKAIPQFNQTRIHKYQEVTFF